MLGRAVHIVCLGLSGVSGAGPAFGVKGHRLPLGVSYKALLSHVSAWRCGLSASVSYQSPGTSHSGSRGVSSAGYCMLACSWLWPPGCLHLTILSGGRGSFSGSTVVCVIFIEPVFVFP